MLWLGSVKQGHGVNSRAFRETSDTSLKCNYHVLHDFSTRPVQGDFTGWPHMKEVGMGEVCYKPSKCHSLNSVLVPYACNMRDYVSHPEIYVFLAGLNTAFCSLHVTKSPSVFAKALTLCTYGQFTWVGQRERNESSSCINSTRISKMLDSPEVCLA